MMNRDQTTAPGFNSYSAPAFYTLVECQVWHPTPYPPGGGNWRKCDGLHPPKPKVTPKLVPPPAPKAPRVEVTPPAAPAAPTPQQPEATAPPPAAAKPEPSPAVPPAPAPPIVAAPQADATTGSANPGNSAVIGQLKAISSEAVSSKFVVYSDIGFLLAGTVLTVMLVRRAVLLEAVYRPAVQERAVRTVQNVSAWIAKLNAEYETAEAERRHRAEWKRFERMPPARFAAFLKQQDAKVSRLHTWATRTDDQAERIEASDFAIPIVTRWRINHLRSHSEKFAADAITLFDDLERIKNLYADIEAARAVKTRDKAVADVRYLLGLLRSQSDTAAKSALSKLNRHRDADWMAGLPSDIEGAARTQAAKWLTFICGNDNINEARNALSKLLSILGPDWLT